MPVNFGQLQSTLLMSGLQTSNPSLYQVIEQLISASGQLQNNTTTSINDIINNLPHDLLDADIDQDTIAHPVVAGDLIFGNSTPKWDALAINPGLLYSVGGVIAWSTTPTVTSITGHLIGNADTATKLFTGRTISITGDLSYTSPSFDGSGNVTAVGTLATVATAGTTGGSTAIPVITINAKGLVTSITTAVIIAPAGTLTGTTLASNVVTSSLTTVGTLATGVWQATKIGLAYGGTNADLSATGGTSQVLKQSSSGAAITVGTLASSNLSDSSNIPLLSAANVFTNAQTLAQNSGNKIVTIGGSPTGGDAAILNFFNSNTQKNWRIITSNQIGGDLEFQPTTVAGATSTFNTCLVLFGTTGISNDTTDPGSGNLRITGNITTATFTGTLNTSASSQAIGGNTLITGTFGVSGACSLSTGTTGNKTITFGGSPADNSACLINILASSTQKNWQIITNNQVGGDLEFRASTADGGSTFSGATLILFGTGGTNIGGGTTDPGATNLRVEGNSHLGTTDNFSWNTKSVGTTYQATSDGFVVFLAALISTAYQSFLGLTDGSSTPGTLRARCGQSFVATNTEYVTMMFPVKKGDYWLVSQAGDGSGNPSTVLNWVPNGFNG